MIAAALLARIGLDPLASTLGALYAGCGLTVAAVLGRRGHAPAVALSAVACWPLLLPLLRTTAAPPAGPLHGRIVEVVAALREIMAEPGVDAVAMPADLDGLAAALARADERLAMVDRMLASVASDAAPTPGVAQGVAQLQRARVTTAAEIEAVLDGMVQLRLQIGLRSLAGNGVPVQERLRDLRCRLAALDELAALELDR
jgi:hypothetical protein